LLELFGWSKLPFRLHELLRANVDISGDRLVWFKMLVDEDLFFDRSPVDRDKNETSRNDIIEGIDCNRDINSWHEMGYLNNAM
jgi:hypothetical protein